MPGIDIESSYPLFVAAALFAFGVGASLYRLMVGPSLPDRVVALDLLGFLVIGLICLVAIATDVKSLLAVALVAALILFLGTAAFAIYLQRRGAP
ncbi:MAG: monovalent cation/H+ antiporter complex subunit F [Planctomycetota bacterium]